jgi:hypothetical protein
MLYKCLWCNFKDNYANEYDLVCVIIHIIRRKFHIFISASLYFATTNLKNKFKDMNVIKLLFIGCLSLTCATGMAQHKYEINTNVTSIVNKWSSSLFNNYGFIIRQTQSQEFINNTNQQVTLKFFSRDTNTIYPPCLQISYNDFIWNTGSSSQSILNTLPAVVNITQNPGTFNIESINRFRVNARPEYPIPIWTTSSVYTNNYYLPTQSYWALKDLETNEYIIDFDDIYTKLSADSTSSYFDLNMNFLQPERYYTILIKSNIQETTQIFDNQYYFKVANG